MFHNHSARDHAAPLSTGEESAKRSLTGNMVAIGKVVDVISVESPTPRGRVVPAKLYVVGRADLPPGLRVAQMFHAARQFAEDHPEEESSWFRESNTIVLLEVADLSEMEKLIDRAKSSNATITEFSEPDFIDVGTTAIAVGPNGRRIVSSLPLALRTDQS
jgi:peptidyl-tRNA hydrolase